MTSEPCRYRSTLAGTFATRATVATAAVSTVAPLNLTGVRHDALTGRRTGPILRAVHTCSEDRRIRQAGATKITDVLLTPTFQAYPACAEQSTSHPRNSISSHLRQLERPALPCENSSEIKALCNDIDLSPTRLHCRPND